jgi:hypothetical protein
MDEYFMSVHHTHHGAKQRAQAKRWMKSAETELHRVQGKKPGNSRIHFTPRRQEKKCEVEVGEKKTKHK